jgi:predicted phosphodiesterase
VDVIIFGHSHNGLSLVKNGILYFNPGSPTDKIYAKANSVGIIEINDRIEGKIVEI